MNEKDFRELLCQSTYLDEDCLEKGIRHIQLSESVINPSGNPYYYLDAVFIGSDNRLYFFVSDNDGQIAEKNISEIRPRDLVTMYNKIKKHQIQK